MTPLRKNSLAGAFGGEYPFAGRRCERVDSGEMIGRPIDESGHNRHPLFVDVGPYS